MEEVKSSGPLLVLDVDLGGIGRRDGEFSRPDGSSSDVGKAGTAGTDSGRGGGALDLDSDSRRDARRNKLS